MGIFTEEKDGVVFAQSVTIGGVPLDENKNPVQGRADRSAHLVHTQEAVGSNPTPATNLKGDAGFYEPDSKPSRGGQPGSAPRNPNDRHNFYVKEKVLLCMWGTAALLTALGQLYSYHSEPAICEASEYEVIK